MNIKILIVDDDHQILKAFKRLFLETDYSIFYSDSGTSALKILDENIIDIVITDMKMPEMDGYKLLSIIKGKYPNIIKIGLSGHSDVEFVLKALEENLIKIFLFKPWENKNILDLLEKVIQVQKVLKDKDLYSLINKIDKIPTLPETYNKFCILINNDASSEKIADLIMKDQSIASRVLRVANSAYYGVKTASVKKSITFIGFNMIKYIILTNGIYKDLNMSDEFKKIIWEYPCLTSKIALEINKKTRGDTEKGICESASLLHSIGRLVIANNFKDRHNEIYSILKKNKEEKLYQLEKEKIGNTHEEIGAYLLDWWGLPHDIVETALFYNNPIDDRIINKELVSIIHIASYYSWKILFEEKFNVKKLEKKVFNIIKITEKECDEIISKFNL